MSQFGMSMPGGRRSRGGGVDVYSGLLCLAVITLGVAVFLMFQAATKVSPDAGNPFALHDDGRAISLPQ